MPYIGVFFAFVAFVVRFPLRIASLAWSSMRRNASLPHCLIASLLFVRVCAFCGLPMFASFRLNAFVALGCVPLCFFSVLLLLVTYVCVCVCVYVYYLCVHCCQLPHELTLVMWHKMWPKQEQGLAERGSTQKVSFRSSGIRQTAIAGHQLNC